MQSYLIKNGVFNTWLIKVVDETEEKETKAYYLEIFASELQFEELKSYLDYNDITLNLIEE